VLSLIAPPVASKKQQREMYDKWGRDPVMFALVKAAVINACTAKKACADDILLLTRIPRTTMRQHKAAFQEAAKLHIIHMPDDLPKSKICASVNCRRLQIPGGYSRRILRSSEQWHDTS
jgi:hypothetical protein